MIEYYCAYEGLCNLQYHPFKNVNGSWEFVQSCLVDFCAKDKNYLLPISELLAEKRCLEKDVNKK